MNSKLGANSTIPDVIQNELDPQWFVEFKTLAKEKLKTLSIPDSKQESWRKVKFSGLNLNEIINSENDIEVKIQENISNLKLVSPGEDLDTKIINKIKKNLNSILDSNDFYKLFTLAYSKNAYILDIPNNFNSKEPIQIHSTYKSSSISAIQMLFINLGINSNIVLHEKIISPNHENIFFLNSLTVFNLDDSSHAEIIHEEDFNNSVMHIRNIEYNLGRDTKSTVYYFNLDGYRGKTFLTSNLNDKGGESNIYGIAVPSKKEIQDVEFTLNHLESYTSSKLKFKTVMKDKSHHVFTGNLNIPRTSLHVEASQLNNNLVLNKTSRAESMPKLEVFADDVKCSHGATMSEINEDQLFYLLSRGLSLSESRHLIVEGYISEVLDGLNNNTLSLDIKEKFLKKIGI